MRYTDLSERTVRTALDRLEAEGIIRPCDPAIVAAKIKRADQRPQGWDLAMHLVRDDMDDEDLAAPSRTGRERSLTRRPDFTPSRRTKTALPLDNRGRAGLLNRTLVRYDAPVIHTTTEDTMATDLARAILAAGSPWADRWPDGTFNSALPGTGAPFGEAQ